MGNLDPAPSSAPAEPPPSSLGRALLFLERHHRLLSFGSVGSAAIGLVLLAVGFFGRVSEGEPPPRMSFAGFDIPQGPESEAFFLELARRWASGSLTIVIPGSEERPKLSRAELGVEVDRARISRWVEQMSDGASPTRRRLREMRTTELALPPPFSMEDETALSALYRLKDKVDRSPRDAWIDIEKKRVMAEQPGRWLDIWGTLARIENALLAGLDEAEAIVTTKPPKVTAAALAEVKFDEVLGWFETRYARGQKYEARIFNLALAASKLDGHVLFPGEEFDFNAVVGPRDEANGYKVATVIASGELVDGIGGGTCQIAGTLHGAAMFSGLEVVERRPHTRPSSYIKMGLDAAVVYPTITLRLRNPFSYPVVLHQVVKDGAVRAEVLGPKGARKTVTYIRKIDGFTAFQEVERPDPKLPKGVKTLAQRGIPGFRLRRYRLVRDGAFAERERWNDYYPPTAQIIRVGTGDMPKDSVRVVDDPHPEYVADAYLMMMQGPEVEHPKGMVEVRQAGESGRYGWTERAGFSHWSPGKQTREGEGEACLEAACARSPQRAKAAPEKAATKKADSRSGGEKGRIEATKAKKPKAR